MESSDLTDQDRAAIKVIKLAKALVLADNHFLSAAVGRLRMVPGRFLMPMATNGFELGVDSAQVCNMFLNTKEPPKHDFLHSVLHCVFLHPYIGPTIGRRLWDVACDIAVEKLVSEVCGARGGSRAKRIESAIGEIEKVTGPHLSAEKVYRELRAGRWSGNIGDWELLFAADDHMPWYLPSTNDRNTDDTVAGERKHSENDRQVSGIDDLQGSDEIDEDGSRHDGEGAERSRDIHDAGGKARDTGKHAQSASQEESNSNNGEPAKNADAPSSGQSRFPGSSAANALSVNRGAFLREVARPSRNAEMEGWRRVAKSLAINLQTYSKGRGRVLSGLVDELEESSRTRVDYVDFLRQFAIPGEMLKASEDEFDYIFYTYGLKLYGNLPLIEPIEYREEKRIREFVIVIDTSGSVWGNIVRRFIDATFNILKSTEAFFEHVHVRIIQCDAAVRSDDTITNLAELKAWGQRMRFFGGGGTDFRPAFAYVDKLVEDGEFKNLGGLVYFTDGFGTYPEWMPEYKTAFVFYDNNYRQECVPPWAAQIVLDDEAIEHIGRR